MCSLCNYSDTKSYVQIFWGKSVCTECKIVFLVFFWNKSILSKLICWLKYKGISNFIHAIHAKTFSPPQNTHTNTKAYELQTIDRDSLTITILWQNTALLQWHMPHVPCVSTIFERPKRPKRNRWSYVQGFLSTFQSWPHGKLMSRTHNVFVQVFTQYLQSANLLIDFQFSNYKINLKINVLLFNCIAV